MDINNESSFKEEKAEDIPVVPFSEPTRVETSSISDLLNKEDEEKPFSFETEDKNEKPVDNIFEKNDDVMSFGGIIDTPNEETPVEPSPATSDDDETMMDLFKRLGLSEIMFVESELTGLMDLEDKEIVEKNVGILNKYGINLDIVSDNVNILSDPELDEKISAILEAGKTKEDIYFNPSVLKKYDLNGLTNAINLLKENGLDPKKVPLMAY